MSANMPLNASSTKSNVDLREGNKFSKEFVLDRKREIIWQPDAFQNATGPASLLTFGTATAPLNEMNTSEIAAIVMDASADSHGVLWAVPDTLDVAEDIYFRLFWSNSAAAATGSAQFGVAYTPLVPGTTAVAVGATALDTVIADQADAAAEVGQWTDDWVPGVDPTSGILDGGTLTAVPGDDFLALHLVVTLTTITDAAAFALQTEFGRAYV